MPEPRGVVWPAEPHTLAKHRLVCRYLQAWFPVLLQAGWPGVIYAEGFAGSGVYRDGEPGSPVIALEVFLRQRYLLDAGKFVNLVLVDQDRDRLQQLRHEMGLALARHARPKPRTLRVAYRHGDCADELAPALEEVSGLGHPVFAFLDSFGGPDVPFSLVETVARHRASEVLITFAPRFLTRFGEQDVHRSSGDRAFGGSHWQGVFSQPPDRKKDYLVTAYRKSLNKAGFGYVASFEMLDNTGHDLQLVFATTSTKGLEKMKDAMWTVDPTSGVRYRDPRDPAQQELDIAVDPNTELLRRTVLARLSQGEHTVGELQTYALLETVYRPQHVRPAVRSLLKAGRVQSRPTSGRLSTSTAIRLTEPPPGTRYEAPTLF